MIKGHTLNCGSDGWFLSVFEKPTSSWLIEKAISATCCCWWGRYRNLPFCWINPWGWTWRIGPEGRTLGDLWMNAGQRLHTLEDRGWREILRIPLSKEQAAELDPEFVGMMSFLDEGEE